MTSSSIQSRLARGISHVLNPAAVAIAVFWTPVVSHGGAGWPAASVTAVVYSLIPGLIMLHMKRVAGLVDIYNPAPPLRRRILLVGTICYLMGYVILHAMEAAPFMRWAAASFALAAACVWAIDHYWKISIHAVGVAGGVFLLMVVAQEYWWPLLAAPGLVAWARLKLGAHSPGQIAAGTTLGVLVPGLLLAIFI